MASKPFYDQAFQLLTQANECEKSGAVQSAVNLLGEAIILFGNIYNSELDSRKKDLLASKIEQLSKRKSCLMANHGPSSAIEASVVFPDVPTFIPVTVVPLSSAPNLSADDSVSLEDHIVNGDRFLQEAQLNERKSELIVAREFYTKSAEQYLFAAKILARRSRNSDREVRLRSTCHELLSKVESISGMEVSQDKAIQQPSHTSRSPLSAAELSVLRQSSSINGWVFLPWIAGDGGREKFHYMTPFNDPDGLMPLSAKHMSRFHQWCRLADVSKYGEPCMIANPTGAISPESIVQDIVPDCSLISSLCIACVFELRFRKRLVSCCIFPQDSSCKPIYNPSGKYMVRLFLNGIWRRVIIDDLFPVDAYKQILCCSSRVGNEFWMTVIEKAYMKVNGGYDFPGSNSCIDLFALTGWIPEQIFLNRSTNTDDDDVKKKNDGNTTTCQDHEQTPERAWQRMVSAQGYGDCLITISTGPITPIEEAKYGLVSGHAYAVLDVKEIKHLRLLKIKNPWARRSWKGRFSVLDQESWTPVLMNLLSTSMATMQDEDENGIFWMSYADVLTYFRTIFLNWNPDLFRFKQTIHSIWPVTQGPANDSYVIGQNPQYRLQIHDSRAPVVWILFTRHVMRKEVDETHNGDYCSVRIYSNSGSCDRIYYPGDHLVSQSPYTNNPHVLVRLDNIDAARPGSVYSIVLSQSRKSRDVLYSIMIFGTCEFDLTPTPLPPPISQKYSGQWADGGPVGSNCFPNNPRIRFNIVCNKGEVVRMHLELLAGKDLSIRLDLQTQKKNENETILLCNSKEYRRGFCYLDYSCSEQESAEFIIIPSTYTERSQGSFFVTICCTHQFSLVL